MLSSDTARFLPPLLLSLLIHVLVAAYWFGQIDVSIPAKQAKRELTLLLQRAGTPAAEVTSQDSSQNTATKPVPRQLEEAQATRPKPLREPRDLNLAPIARNSPMTKRLDLSLPVDVSASSDASGDLGARVFDPGLLRLLQQHKRSPRAGRKPIPGVDETMSVSSFSAGRWETFLQVGDSCFEVIEADPLQPLSVEQWYRVKCD